MGEGRAGAFFAAYEERELSSVSGAAAASSRPRQPRCAAETRSQDSLPGRCCTKIKARLHGPAWSRRGPGGPFTRSVPQLDSPHSSHGRQVGFGVWHSGTHSGHGGSRLVPALKEKHRSGLQPEPELESTCQTTSWPWEQAGELVGCKSAARCSVNLSHRCSRSTFLSLSPRACSCFSTDCTELEHHSDWCVKGHTTSPRVSCSCSQRSGSLQEGLRRGQAAGESLETPVLLS